MNNRLLVTEGRVTIDGSTAPGQGITLLHHGIHFGGDCDDIIVRHLRIRVTTGGSSGDCLPISSLSIEEQMKATSLIVSLLV